MHTTIANTDAPSPTQSIPMLSLDGSEKIDRWKKSSSSGISSNFHGAHQDSSTTLALQEKDRPVSDLKSLHLKRHSDLLDFVQESNVKESFRSHASHICRYCKRRFSSGRALGGHMRTHSAQFTESSEKEEFSGNKSHLHSEPESENRSAWIHFKQQKGIISEFQRYGASQTRNIEDLPTREEEDAMSIHESSSSEANNDIELSPKREFPHSKGGDTVHPLYALRRNPKRSRRLTDQEFAFDSAARIQIAVHAAKRTSSSSPERTRTCSECGKEFPSWKALFGHMRCHPEREWRGIQPPEMGGSQDKAGSGLGISAWKRKFAIHGIGGEDSRLAELEPDLDNEGVEELEASSKRLDANVIEMRLKVANSKDVEEEGACNKRGAAEKFTSKRDQGTVAERTLDREKGEESDIDSDLESVQRARSYTWSQHRFLTRMTGKRSKRSRHTPKPLKIDTYEEPDLDSVTSPTEMKEEVDTTDCLIMLAYAGKSLEEAARTQRELTEESAFSDSGRNCKADQRNQRIEKNSQEQETNWIGNLVKGIQRCGKDKKAEEANLREGPVKRGQVKDIRQKAARDSSTKYECNTCKRIFNSHQALGGHRASHRRVKGCFAKTTIGEESHECVGEDNTNDEYLNPEDDLQTGPHSLHQHDSQRFYRMQWDDVQEMITAKKFKGHECSICHRVFASGQALGGHKRCHWTGEKATATSVASSNKQASPIILGKNRIPKEDYLDLNLPAPLDDDDMEVAYNMVVVVPGYSRLFNAKTAEETTEGPRPTGSKTGHDTTLEDSHRTDEMHSGAPISVDLDSRLQTNAESGENQEYETNSQLKFRSQFLYCNICDSIFSSLEAFSNHQKSHASSLSSIAGLTPISA